MIITSIISLPAVEGTSQTKAVYRLALSHNSNTVALWFQGVCVHTHARARYSCRKQTSVWSVPQLIITLSVQTRSLTGLNWPNGIG